MVAYLCGKRKLIIFEECKDLVIFESHTFCGWMDFCMNLLITPYSPKYDVINYLNIRGRLVRGMEFDGIGIY